MRLLDSKLHVSAVAGSVVSVCSHVSRWPHLFAPCVGCPLTPRKWSVPPVWKNSWRRTKLPAGGVAKRWARLLLRSLVIGFGFDPHLQCTRFNVQCFGWTDDLPFVRWPWLRCGPTLHPVLKYRSKLQTAPSLCRWFPPPSQFPGKASADHLHCMTFTISDHSGKNALLQLTIYDIRA